MIHAPKLLIVEDEWLVAEDLAILLAEAGYDIGGPVPSQAKAIELIDIGAIDGAILDIHLNNECSFPIADHLIAKSIPFLFVSGYSSDILPKRLDTQQILSKPCKPAVLLAAVSEMLDHKKLH